MKLYETIYGEAIKEEEQELGTLHWDAAWRGSHENVHSLPTTKREPLCPDGPRTDSSNNTRG
jgi:hypothetical protein